MPVLNMGVKFPWVLFVMTTINIAPHAEQAVESLTILESNACYGSEGHIINELQCEEKQVIAIQRLSFGAKTNGSCPSSITADSRNTSTSCCVPDSTDNCTMSGESDMPRANSICSGHQSCSKLRAERIRTLGKCDWLSRDYTNYMTAHYRCIPVSRIVEFCHSTTLLGSSMYLASDNYPQNLLAQNYNCECMVTTSGALGVYAVDVPTSYKPSCGQRIEINDALNQSSPSITCKDPAKFGYTLLHTGRDVLNLKLVSKFPNSPWRFWLYIRGNSDTKLVCNKKIPTSSSVIHTSSTISLLSFQVILAVSVSI